MTKPGQADSSVPPELFRYMVLRPPQSIAAVTLQPADGATRAPEAVAGLRLADDVDRLQQRSLGSSTAAELVAEVFGRPARDVVDSDEFRADISVLDNEIAAIMRAGTDPDGDGDRLCRLRQGYDLLTQLAEGASEIGQRPLALSMLDDGPAPTATTPAHAVAGDLRPGIYQIGRHAVELTGSVAAVAPAADPPPVPTIRPAGIGDLIVVREHTLRYQGGELAHIQNVLKTEHLDRETRRLDRTEETTTVETDTEQETTQDTQTTERFELDQETAKTVKNDSELKTGLSVSASYGPTVQVKADINTDQKNSQEDAAKQAAKFGKDVTQRSVSKLTQKVKTVRSTTTLSEFEEYNKHGFDNTNGLEHVSGVYQWVDKVSRAQMYNYGKRMLFDLVVPEPAAFLIAAAAGGGAEAAVAKPDPLALSATDLSEDPADANYYAKVAARYYTTGVEPPPAKQLTITKSFAGGNNDHPEASKSDTLEIAVPAGYRAVTVEHNRSEYTFGENAILVDINSDLVIGGGLHTLTEPNVGNVTISIVSWGEKAFTLAFTVTCARTDQAFSAWQHKVYDTIATRYTKLRSDYDNALAEAKTATANQIQGRNPIANHQLEIEELKKYFLAILTRSNFDGYGAITNDTQNGLPTVDVAAAVTQGPNIRFFEQAFEWEQIQYVLYPYFWGRKAGWRAQVLTSDPDPDFAAFVKAGAARVVVPVRPGFSDHVLYFLINNKTWGGGTPPPVTDPTYLPIAQEIRNAEAAPAAETAVKDGNWEVRVPTTLVRIRKDDDLPEWRQLPDGSWQEVQPS